MFVKELTKKYDGKPVVDSVTFDIPKGSVISLIGPNGAGKSTVMGMISRLIAKDTGMVEFDGKDIVAKDVLDQAVKAYKKSHRGAEIKDVQLYIVANEGAAYYVVNGEASDDYKILL